MKELLFDKYSRNLDDVLSLIPNLKRSGNRLYMCPLCRVIFSEEHLNQTCENPLTIEHIPPKSVGGKEMVLTCKKCNNEHGSKFDSHLIEKLAFKKLTLLKPGTVKKNLKYKIGNEISANGNLFVDQQSNINFVLEEKRTNPKFHRDIIDFVTGKRGDVKVDFSLQTYNENKVKISVLRSAYLKTFKELGYAFIINSNSDIPRKVIMEYPDVETIRGVYSASENNCILGLSVITKPAQLQGYIVGLKILKDDVEELYNVFLPGGNTQSRQLYSELEKMKSGIESNDASNFEITLLDGENYLGGDNKLFALEHWGNQYTIHKGLPK